MTMRLLPTLRTLLVTTLYALAAIAAGCTSLGHETRAIPQISRAVPEPQTQVVLAPGAGELSVALERLFESRGIRVLASADNTSKRPGARYLIAATSADLDICLPEGSRQMHFNIIVVDTVANQRAYVLSGQYGCQDTLLKQFETWFFQSAR